MLKAQLVERVEKKHGLIIGATTQEKSFHVNVKQKDAMSKL